ncbi:hypothetical protein HFO63_17320 [Rhizobium laguerreae]|uniref:hypothetical protein n=1 Tax=Rhizobium TaxID=379 RepID=UPI001441BB65|nr:MULTISPECIES: hypothetical protein [Rhizobium]MBY3035796.1 hypothetical protein [Rhizobium laguerreae]MBY3049351.1 hypothetical protein [Rhizobium laguerreae]MBY3086912.1 hypothetical protein [Rhizobium laguerreae]MBY3147320.1 hypothetical protein [Rhizobium laguerreae]MBY3215085.1 hypothetical protein [Rhizobium laguerreae]
MKKIRWCGFISGTLLRLRGVSGGITGHSDEMATGLRSPQSQDYRSLLLTSPVSMMQPPLISQFHAEQQLQLKAAKHVGPKGHLVDNTRRERDKVVRVCPLPELGRPR